MMRGEVSEIRSLEEGSRKKPRPIVSEIAFRKIGRFQLYLHEINEITEGGVEPVYQISMAYGSRPVYGYEADRSGAPLARRRLVGWGPVSETVLTSSSSLESAGKAFEKISQQLVQAVAEGRFVIKESGGVRLLPSDVEATSVQAFSSSSH
jgi:hypothetical protein